MRLLSIFLLFTLSSYAEVEFLDFAIPEFITSSQSLGMGNANFGENFGPYTAFTNPSSIGPLNRNEKYRFGIINFSGEFSSDTFKNTFGEKGISFESVQTGIDFLSNTNMRKALVDDNGGYLYQRLGVLSYFQLNNFTIGHFSSHQSNGALVSKNDNFYGNRREDYGPYLTYSNLIGRKFSIGVTYTYLKRSETHSVIDSTGANISNSTVEGEMNHVVSSLKYLLDRQFFISFVNRNSLGSTFGAGSSLVTKIPNTTDFAMTFYTSRRKMQYNLVLRDIGNGYSDFSSSRKFQFGMNYLMKRSGSFQLGVFDGQLSGGFFIKTKSMGSYGISTYAVNTSITDVMDTDRRFVLEFSI